MGNPYLTVEDKIIANDLNSKMTCEISFSQPKEKDHKPNAVKLKIFKFFENEEINVD